MLVIVDSERGGYDWQHRPSRHPADEINEIEARWHRHPPLLGRFLRVVLGQPGTTSSIVQHAYAIAIETDPLTDRCASHQ